MPYLEAVNNKQNFPSKLSKFSSVSSGETPTVSSSISSSIAAMSNEEKKEAQERLRQKLFSKKK